MKPESVIAPEIIKDMLKHASHTPKGCFIEVGVYRGGSAFHLATLAQTQNRAFYGYDTFEGIPFSEEGDIHRVGDFSATEYEDVCAAIPHGTFIKGIFPHTFLQGDYDVAFVHLDVDQKKSYRDAIDTLLPKMVKGAIMWFDEPSDPKFPDVAKLVKDRFGKSVQVAPCGKWFTRI